MATITIPHATGNLEARFFAGEGHAAQAMHAFLQGAAQLFEKKNPLELTDGEAAAYFLCMHLSRSKTALSRFSIGHEYMNAMPHQVQESVDQQSDIMDDEEYRLGISQLEHYLRSKQIIPYRRQFMHLPDLEHIPYDEQTLFESAHASFHDPAERGIFKPIDTIGLDTTSTPAPCLVYTRACEFVGGRLHQHNHIMVGLSDVDGYIPGRQYPQ